MPRYQQANERSLTDLTTYGWAGSSSVRISVRTHLEFVEASPLDFCGDAVADQPLDEAEKAESQTEHHDEIGEDPDGLSSELPRIAEENTPHRAGNAVPSIAVAAVGKNADRQRTPCSANAVHRDRADRIVDAEAPFESHHRPRNQEPRHHANEHRGRGRDERAGAGDGD